MCNEHVALSLILWYIAISENDFVSQVVLTVILLATHWFNSIELYTCYGAYCDYE